MLSGKMQGEKTRSRFYMMSKKASQMTDAFFTNRRCEGNQVKKCFDTTGGWQYNLKEGTPLPPPPPLSPKKKLPHCGLH